MERTVAIAPRLDFRTEVQAYRAEVRIGEVAERAGVNGETLRYYERRGLLGPTGRAASGFREYDANAVRQVRFIRRAQDLGFTLAEIRDLLGLWADSSKSCSAVEKRQRDTGTH